MKKLLTEGYFRETLKSKGLKATPGRLEMLLILARLHAPLSAEDICGKLRSAQVDRATVYRTLSSFVQAGILKKVSLQTGAEHFELNDDHHHHLVCTECGAIEDFERCDVEDATKAILKHSGFKSVSAHSLELFGTCKSCARA